MLHERSGLGFDIGSVGAEQLRFDRMKSARRLRPGVDLLVELRDESTGEDLGTLPSGTGIDPRLLGASQIVGHNALVQTLRARQGTSDVLDEEWPVALDRIVKRRGGCDAFDRTDRAGGYDRKVHPQIKTGTFT